MNVQWVLISLFLTVLVSCKNDPYPVNTTFELVGKKVEKTRQDNLLFLYVTNEKGGAVNTMRFVEGEETIYKIEGSSPSGAASIEISSLPNGVDWNPDTGELKWTPSYSDADHPADYRSTFREYKLNIQLYDGADSSYFSEKEIPMIVFDTAQGVVIETDSNAEFREESSHSQYIDLSYEDGNRATVTTIHSNDIPEGATIHEITRGRKYRISFRPEPYFVTTYDTKDSDGRYYKDVSFDIQAIDSRGNVTTKIVNWRVYDKIKPIDVFYPKKINVDGDVFFTVVVVDRNGEEPPSLAADPKPTFSSRLFYITRKIFSSYYTKEGEKWSFFSVYWKDVPPHKLGKTHNLKFKSCANFRRDCRRFSVDIHFAKKNGVRTFDAEPGEDGKIEEDAKPGKEESAEEPSVTTRQAALWENGGLLK